MGSTFLFIVLATACLVFVGRPSVDATFPWSRHLPLDSRPEICDMKLVSGNRTFDPKVLLHPNFNLKEYKLVLPEDDPRLGPHAHVHTVQSEDLIKSMEPGGFCLWLGRLGYDVAGALVGPRQILTLADCITNYRSWIHGYRRLAVNVCGQDFQVTRVDFQENHDYPLAMISLAEVGEESETLPVCVGEYQPSLPARAMTWIADDGLMLQEHNVTMYPNLHCTLHEEDYLHEHMLCSTRGPMMCGSPLVQVVDGRYRLVGLGTGWTGEVSSYVRLGDSRKWLMKFHLM